MEREGKKLTFRDNGAATNKGVCPLLLSTIFFTKYTLSLQLLMQCLSFLSLNILGLINDYNVEHKVHVTIKQVLCHTVDREIFVAKKFLPITVNDEN